MGFTNLEFSKALQVRHGQCPSTTNQQQEDPSFRWSPRAPEPEDNQNSVNSMQCRSGNNPGRPDQHPALWVTMPGPKTGLHSILIPNKWPLGDRAPNATLCEMFSLQSQKSESHVYEASK
jgi:hypothetical protein